MDARQSRLAKAKKQAFDEFYSRYETIEKELVHYENQLRGKSVICNCDDVEKSNFIEYLCRQAPYIGITKVIGVRYEGPNATESWYVTYTPPEDIENYDADNWKDYLIKTRMTGNGGFQTPESMELLDQCDVCITNPPFSIFSEFIDLLIQKEKKFLIIANQNCVAMKNIFPLFKDEKIWLGYVNMGTPEYFRVPDYYKETLINENKTRKEIDGEVMAKVSTIWLTNLETTKRHEPLQLVFSMEQHDKPYYKYDNYEAYNVDKVNDIPYDSGNKILGVPISYLSHHNSEQFEIIGCSQRGCHERMIETRTYDNYWEVRQDGSKTGYSGAKVNSNPNILQNDGKHNYFTNNEGRIIQSCYHRIFIRRRQQEEES